MARKTEPPPGKPQKVALELADYQFPGEKKTYWKGMGATLGLFAWMALMVYWFRGAIFGAQLYSGGPLNLSWRFWWTELVILGYPWVAFVTANLLATNDAARGVKEAGKQRKVSPNNFHDLYRKLNRFSQLAGLENRVEMYLLDDPDAYIYAIPAKAGTIVASTGLRDGLKEDELSALLARQIGRIKSRHVRTELAIDYVEQANPVLQVVLFPIWMVEILGTGWREMNDYTADRFAMLLMGSSSVVTRALVKGSALADTEADITPGELHDYLESTGEMSTDVQQMERHFRLSNFISRQPNLQERIEAVKEFAADPAAQEAMAKLEKIRSEIDGSA